MAAGGGEDWLSREQEVNDQGTDYSFSVCVFLDFCVRAAWRDRRCDLCPQQPPPTGEHLSARDTRTSVPFGGFGTCGAVAESPSAAAWREMGPGQLAL